MREFRINFLNQTFRDPNGQQFQNNTVKTAKYTVLTFFPLNLLVQFSKMANFYFLLLCLLELYPPVKTAGGFITEFVPLCLVVGVSMIKDVFEDRKRHQSDDEENKRPARCIRRGENRMLEC